MADPIRPAIPHSSFTGVDPTAQRQLLRNFQALAEQWPQIPPPIFRGSTYWIAPFDASDDDKARADLVLDHVTDTAAINALIAAHSPGPNDSITLRFFKGDVSITGTLNPPNLITGNHPSVSFIGQDGLQTGFRINGVIADYTQIVTTGASTASVVFAQGPGAFLEIRALNISVGTLASDVVLVHHDGNSAVAGLLLSRLSLGTFAYLLSSTLAAGGFLNPVIEHVVPSFGPTSLVTDTCLVNEGLFINLAGDWSTTVNQTNITNSLFVGYDNDTSFSTFVPPVPASGNTFIPGQGIDTTAVHSGSSLLPPTGGMIMFGGGAAPTGWVLCDGTSYLRAGAMAALFAVIGTAYGSVDGTHFNVPDLRERFPLGKGGTHALGATGGAATHSHSVPGLSVPSLSTSADAVTVTGTVSSHTHTSAAHTHGLTGASVGSHTHTMGLHTHTSAAHTHGLTGASVGSHTHALTAAGVASHTHTSATHQHNLSANGQANIVIVAATPSFLMQRVNASWTSTVGSTGLSVSGNTTAQNLGAALSGNTDNATPGATGAATPGLTGSTDATTPTLTGPTDSTTPGATGATTPTWTQSTGTTVAGTTGTGTTGTGTTGTAAGPIDPFVTVNYIIKT